jgi:hypothetical protein
LSADGESTGECREWGLTVPLYLSAETVAEALTRLQQSSAQSRLCEFLIGLRTLTLSDDDYVQVAESIPEFKEALNELTACVPPGVPNTFDGEPYINPFGTARGRATGRAYKSRKFPSNGPSNTMHGWATQPNSPFDIIDNIRPKGIRRRKITQEQLRQFLLLRGANLEERPRLIDAAVWYFRATDLEEWASSEPSEEQLAEQFSQAIGLTALDIEALFVTDQPEA